MPRLARLDAPGVVHHIIIRGIERRKIFRDNRDRENFLERLGNLLLETKTGCYGWAFLQNHAHFLLRTGKVPLATVMRRLLTVVPGVRLSILQFMPDYHKGTQGYSIAD
jgi:REP element-mobilizing transposase RayT